jgi:hypothetical protein
MNNYIAQRTQKQKGGRIEALRKLSADDIVTILKEIEPNMYFSVGEEDYYEFAEFLLKCSEGEADNLRIPEEDDYVIEDGEMSSVFVCDMDKIREKVKAYFAD